MIERRLFQSLSGHSGDWLEAKHHFSPADKNSSFPQPTANELQGARHQGRRIAEVANKLHG